MTELALMQWEEGMIIKGRIRKQTKLQLFNIGLKRCKNCHRLLGLEHFGQDQSTPLGLTHYCKTCLREINRDYYDRIKARKAKDRRIKKAQIAQLMGGACLRCGYKKFLSALTCHHVRPDQKEYTIANLVGARDFDITRAIVLRELDKCILLCSNCHRGLHAGEWQAEFVKRNGLGWKIAD